MRLPVWKTIAQLHHRCTLRLPWSPCDSQSKLPSGSVTLATFLPTAGRLLAVGQFRQQTSEISLLGSMNSGCVELFDGQQKKLRYNRFPFLPTTRFLLLATETDQKPAVGRNVVSVTPLLVIIRLGSKHLHCINCVSVVGASSWDCCGREPVDYGNASVPFLCY